MKTSILTNLLLVGILMSCQEPDPAPSVIWNPAILQNDTGWTLIGKTRETTGATSDLYAVIPACERDNIYHFTSDSTYQITEGASRCSKDDPPIFETGKWSLDNGVLLFKPVGRDSSALTLDLLISIGWEASLIQTGTNGQVTSVTKYKFVKAPLN